MENFHLHMVFMFCVQGSDHASSVMRGQAIMLLVREAFIKDVFPEKLLLISE